ncbi:hypothetical protein [Elizabethkingia ursingii]|jgi:hypothetical protein|uniref:hypothetical protein n=1 Tax=Elizabethkingia ursingii TaxID=1756150 RepID=UPI002012D342|nr:hypothetical protein [Elizabethkingia ursingii]MCL1670607.1 hypothetical protein [Elizabethkingia ursingii]
MIEQIKNNYELFSDAIIQEINYFKRMNVNISEVHINLYNWATDNRENIILIFKDITLFRFCRYPNLSNSVISNALIKKEKEIITFDFFPIYYSDSHIEENSNSDFIIKCKELELIKN